MPLKDSLKILREAGASGLYGATNRLLGLIDKDTVKGSRDSEEWDILKGYVERLWFLVTKAQVIRNGADCEPLASKIDELNSKIKEASVDTPRILRFLGDDPWNVLDEFQEELQEKIRAETKQTLSQLFEKLPSELEKVKNPTSGDSGLSISFTNTTARTAQDVGSGNVVVGQRKVDLRADNAKFGNIGNLLSGNTHKEAEDKSDGGGEGNTKAIKGRSSWGFF